MEQGILWHMTIWLCFLASVAAFTANALRAHRWFRAGRTLWRFGLAQAAVCLYFTVLYFIVAMGYSVCSGETLRLFFRSAMLMIMVAVFTEALMDL